MSLNYYVLKFRNISKTFKAFNIPKLKQNLLLEINLLKNKNGKAKHCKFIKLAN